MTFCFKSVVLEHIFFRYDDATKTDANLIKHVLTQKAMKNTTLDAGKMPEVKALNTCLYHCM